MNRCPATIRNFRDGKPIARRCGAPLDFIGITVHKVFGWRRWSQCSSPNCGLFVAANEHGDIGIIQKTEPDRRAFRSRGLDEAA